jgi:NADH-quinone oxidoreductase subunit N
MDASSSDLSAIYPEIGIVVVAMTLLMLGVFRREESGGTVNWLAILTLAGMALIVGTSDAAPSTLFGGSFIDDGFARFMKMLVLLGGAATLLMSFDYLRSAGILKFELPVLVLMSTAGMMMMISAGNLIALYLGLEMQSLALYVIAAFQRDAVKSSEAGLKYFVLGALSSGMLLYGASLIYGFTGSTEFSAIAQAAVPPAEGARISVGLVFGLVFVLAGLAFKIAAVPFHMWVPDVYEGAPTPVTAFFAAAPKLAAMALMMRTVFDAFPGLVPQWQSIIIFLSIASMLLGAFAAIGQRNIKRLMAYSSIGHVGYALVGLAAGTSEGIRGVLIYLAIYLVMTLGTFAAILSMRREQGMIEEIDQLAGLARTSLAMATVLALLLFSLAGIPPLAGFWAKWYVFLPAIGAGYYELAVIGVIASVIGAYYYVRIVKIMFFDTAAEPFLPMPGLTKLVYGFAGLFVLLYVVYPAPLVTAAETAARALY